MRARVLVSVAVAATIALGATGCEFMTPQDTKNIKQITDGVALTVGKIDVRNALFISKNGKSARFAGTIINTTGTSKTVSLQTKDETSTAVDVTVPANTTLDLGSNKNTPVIFRHLNSQPGSLVKLFVTYPGTAGGSVRVPVLDGQLKEYSTLVPTTTPSATASATPTAAATAAAKH